MSKLNKLILNGTEFVIEDRRIGSGKTRPTLTSSGDIGFMFFDTNLGKPIWWNGTGWVDATGKSI